MNKFEIAMKLKAMHEFLDEKLTNPSAVIVIIAELKLLSKQLLAEEEKYEE